MATMKNGRKVGMFAALAAMLAPVAKLFKKRRNDAVYQSHHTRGCKGMGRSGFYAISDFSHAAHRRNWAY